MNAATRPAPAAPEAASPPTLSLLAIELYESVARGTARALRPARVPSQVAA